MNYVWEGIVPMRTFNGYVILLEEDHFVSPDFLYILEMLITNKERYKIIKQIIINNQTLHSLCAECNIISLGIYLKAYGTYRSNINHLAIHPFFSSKHNMGMALNRNTWAQIRNCSQLFCAYDDYNWDW
jgi:alpha-1,6-mannosyl-glycoprotein beta-1,2-N-acetylglucosaminyltransferase